MHEVHRQSTDPGGRHADPSRRLAPGWPLAVAFMGYPVWWILGVGEFVLFAAAAVMAYELLHRRDIRAPRGFGWWILFLAWVVVGLLVIQVNAPGAVPGASHSRYLVWGYRLAWFLAATIVLLYVGNNRQHLSTQRLARIMSWMFLVVVVGGLVGTLAPSLTFPSLLEVVLPRSVSSIGFISAQIHPTVAQAYDVQRPSAPFPYANEWGLNFAVFLPFFVASWCHRDAGWRRVAAPFVLTVAVIPVVYSLNRGVWLTLGVMAIFVALRSAALGHVRLLGALMVGILAVSALLAASPLAAMLQARLTQEDSSNEGRTNLVSLSLESMGKKSPVVGYGTTRDVQGTFESIAGGATDICPLCSPPAMGTQGLLWLVAFSTGIGGLVMFLAFFVLTLFRHLRLQSVNATLGLTVLVAMFVTLPIYDLSGPALFGVMAAVGLLWRDSVAQQIPAASASRYRSDEPTLRGYATVAYEGRAVIAACMVAGILLGAGWQASQGTPQTAEISILVPTLTPTVTMSAADTDPTHPVTRPSSLDTEAALVADDAVLAAVQRAVQESGDASSGQLGITAIANSRILNLTYTAGDAATAKAGVTAAALTYVVGNTASLTAERADVLRSLVVRAQALEQAIHTLDQAAHVANRSFASRALRTELITQSQQVVYMTQQVIGTPLEPGRIVSFTTVHAVTDGWTVSVTSGAMLGLLGGISLARLRARRPSITGNIESHDQ